MWLILERAALWRSSFHHVIKPTKHIPGTKTAQERKNPEIQSATYIVLSYTLYFQVFTSLTVFKSLINSCIGSLFAL